MSRDCCADSGLCVIGTMRPCTFMDGATPAVMNDTVVASFASGGRWLDTIGRVVLPLLAPSLMASFLLLFIVGFREFTIPMILQSDDNWVLSVIMWKLQVDRQTGQAAAVGTLILLFVTPVIFLLRRHLLSRQGEA